jgi:hypothetical protein
MYVSTFSLRARAREAVCLSMGLPRVEAVRLPLPLPRSSRSTTFVRLAICFAMTATGSSAWVRPSRARAGRPTVLPGLLDARLIRPSWSEPPADPVSGLADFQLDVRQLLVVLGYLVRASAAAPYRGAPTLPRQASAPSAASPASAARRRAAAQRTRLLGPAFSRWMCPCSSA